MKARRLLAQVASLFFLLLCAEILQALDAGISPPVPKLLNGHPKLIPPQPRDGEGSASAIVPILIYHSIRPYAESDSAAVRRYVVTPEQFEQELAYFKANGYTSISFDELADHLEGTALLPPKPILLSFDDDWASQYSYALPLLEKYGFTGTFYIWVSAVGKKNHMTWEEIQDLVKAGMQIGCHSMSHPYLTRIQSDDELQREVLGAKQLIEARTGVRVTSFAYPFGQYDERVVAAVKAAGFTSARSTWPGVAHTKEGLFSLTGLIRTESEPALVGSLTYYLAHARPTSTAGATRLPS